MNITTTPTEIKARLQRRQIHRSRSTPLDAVRVDGAGFPALASRESFEVAAGARVLGRYADGGAAWIQNSFGNGGAEGTSGLFEPVNFDAAAHAAILRPLRHGCRGDCEPSSVKPGAWNLSIYQLAITNKTKSMHKTLLAFLAFLALAVSAQAAPTKKPQPGRQTAKPQPSAASAPVVDEPLGPIYSRGMTQWHMGHNAEMIRRFHDYVKQQGLTPQKLLPASALKPPTTLARLLLEPELLGRENLNGWNVEGDYITMGNGDNGPTVSLPLRVPRPGLYRLWVQYSGNLNSRGVTFLKIYRKGQEAKGPLAQPDEVYDMPAETAGPQWHDILVNLPVGDLTVQLGLVTRGWQGQGDYDARRIDCLYFTNELWAEPPTAEARQAMRKSVEPAGAQWTLTPPLPVADQSNWAWWQVRPLSWEDAAAKPQLFKLSHAFWESVVNDLATKEYTENAKPDYRAPERQVVYNEIWNMVANPVRARRQIKVLTDDVSREQLNYHYVWHDVGSNVEGLREDGNYKDTPHAAYGNWYGGPGRLESSYGDASGTVTTQVPVTAPGKYTMWVLSSSVNLHYTAPWFGKVSADGKEQFTYHLEGKIPSVWMKMGEVTATKPGKVQVSFTLDQAGAGSTYRRIYTLFLTDDPKIIPSGTVRPPWTMEMFRQRAAQAGATPQDKMLLWLSDDPYRPLSQEVWADKVTPGDAWPYAPVKGTTRRKDLLMARDSNRAVQVGLHNLTDNPLALDVQPGPLQGKGGSFPKAVTWRAEGFIPYGEDRQAWTPFFLMRRAKIMVPPLNVAGVWLTVDTHGVPPGQYSALVKIRGAGVAEHTITLNVRVSPLTPSPKQPILVDGWTQPHEGEAYLRDFVEHGFNVWPGEMSKAEMKRWGIRQLRLRAGSTQGMPEWIAHLKALGLDYDDYFVGILDEPSGTTEEELKPYLDIAKAIRAADPKVRISFNPSEAAQLATFQILAPYCDVWNPYSLHVFSPYGGNPEKWQIFHPKPWMWYTTPNLWDKTARDPGIRLVPSRPGNCIGVAFFALNYPWRDQWDTGYEQIADASTMGAVISRHGPVASIVWEQMQEAAQTANLAMMVRERLGVRTFNEVTAPEMQRLIREGSHEELIRWLEAHPTP